MPPPLPPPLTHPPSAMEVIVAGMPLLESRPERSLLRLVAQRAWSTREPMTPSDWAARYRVLPPKVSDTPGLVDMDKTPYLRGFLDVFADPIVKRITAIKASQLGFTMGLDTLALYAVDQMPTPWLWICPNAELSKEAAKVRIEPGAKECPVVKARMGESKEDNTSKQLDFDLMRISFVGSGNPNNLRSRPAGVVVIDDFERCESYTLYEAKQRVAAFDESKILIVSPPSYEGMGIDREYALSDKRYFAVPCPHCNHMHEWVWENLKWEGGLEADPDAVEQAAWMACPRCKGKIENHHKPGCLRRGSWVKENPGVLSHAGFRISSLYSPWQKFGWVARGFLEAKGKPERVWRNGVLGLAEKAPAAIDVKELKELAKGAAGVPGLEHWKRRTVPADAIALVATVDIQGEYVYVLVTAFSEYGLKAYYVDHFTRPLPANAPLEPVYLAVRDRKYPRADGSGWMRILMQAWDTGHRATDTHAVWLKWQHEKRHVFRLVKGMPSANMTKPWYLARPTDMGENTRARASGVLLLQLNSNLWKTRVAHALRSALTTVRQLADGVRDEQAEDAREADAEFVSLAEASGLEESRVSVILGKTAASGEGVMTALFLPPDVPQDFLEHLCSEQNNAGKWTEIAEHVRNEGWDTAYYAAATADASGMRDLTSAVLPNMLVGAPSEAQMRAWGVRPVSGVNAGEGGGTGGARGAGGAGGVGGVGGERIKNAKPRPEPKKRADLASVRARLAMKLRV
ncbi:MAG: phage terminase large subunit family protein [Planctomycetes bacterium]|nr:phage terminase large subunit family protein [Planctomycetota bacterium]